MAKREETLKKYVGDMLAVDKHILEAIERQTKDKKFQSQPEAAQFVDAVQALLQSFIAENEGFLNRMGGQPAAPLKKAATGVLGVGAGIIDKVRPDAVSEGLRDDYTALNLAAVGYSMLHTTGLALKDMPTAELAQKHLTGLAPMIMRINQILPPIVARELQDEGEVVDTGAGTLAVEHINKAWQNTPR